MGLRLRGTEDERERERESECELCADHGRNDAYGYGPRGRRRTIDLGSDSEDAEIGVNSNSTAASARDQRPEDLRHWKTRGEEAGHQSRIGYRSSRRGCFDRKRQNFFFPSHPADPINTIIATSQYPLVVISS